jgi:hypothetical protein
MSAEGSGGGAARFKIGAKVVASDETCGELAGVIIDPVGRKLTHLIVDPKRRHQGLGHLVPVELVEDDGDPVRLSCTVAEFRKLDDAEEVHFESAADDTWSYTAGEAYAWPYYGVGLVGGMGAGGMTEVDYGHHHSTPQPVSTDRIPTGEVEVRRGDQVHASDGWIGSVKGLVVDPADNHVTHVLLAEGHFWGRKQVAIPIGATSRIEEEIRVDMTKEQIEALPSVSLG